MLLFVRFGGQLTQFSNVTHTQHETDYSVVGINDGRPTQVENLDAAVSHFFLDFTDHQMFVEGEIHDVFTDAGTADGFNLRQGVSAQIGVRKHQIHQSATGDIAGFKYRFQEC